MPSTNYQLFERNTKYQLQTSSCSKAAKVPSTNNQFERSTKYQVQTSSCSKKHKSAKHKQAVVHTIISAFCSQTPTTNVITSWLGTWQRGQQKCRSKPATQVRNDFRSFVRQRLTGSRSKKLTEQRRADSRIYITLIILIVFVLIFK